MAGEKRSGSLLLLMQEEFGIVFPRNSVERCRALVVEVPHKPRERYGAARARTGPVVPVHHRESIGKQVDGSKRAAVENPGAAPAFEEGKPAQHDYAWA